MGVLMEPLPTLAGPSNEEVTLFHNYRLNGEKTAIVKMIDYKRLFLQVN